MKDRQHARTPARDLTPWYPADVEPVREGVYRVVKSFGEVWAHWNGETWSHGSAQEVLTAKNVESMAQSHEGAYPVSKWRGLKAPAC